jgi:Mn-dependent DtxR family transcriptional regulator
MHLPHSFTDTQGQYLALIWAYTQINSRPPAERDLQTYFRVPPPSVHQMLARLQSEGLIRRTQGQARSIELGVDLADLPVLRNRQLVKTSVQRY